MKRQSTLAAGSFLLACLLLVSGCLKDNVRYTYTIQRPIIKTLSEVRREVQVLGPQGMQEISKIYMRGQYIYLVETDKGIHIVDNSIPAAPRNIGFIAIPGNQDMAIQDNILYADCFSDLLAIDISNPQQAKIRQTVDNIFPSRLAYFRSQGNPDSTYVIVGWVSKDTTVDQESSPGPVVYYGIAGCPSCATLSLAPASSSGGTGGSLARFTVINDYLYAISNPDLEVIDIHQRAAPVLVNQINVDFHIETIYPFRDKLFIGSNNGVFMYSVSPSPENPSPAGQFTHVRACDPVIADEQFAYVTLNDGTACLGFDNELQVIDISDMSNPALINTVKMKHPEGLAKDGTALFICDDLAGLKVYRATDPGHLELLAEAADGTARDVIAQHGLALVLAREGLFEYDYTNLAHVRKIGALPFSKN